MTASLGANKRHSFADRGEDFYPSPPVATASLLALEGKHIPRRVLEPACGDGAIVLPLRAAGYEVEATDLIDRGCPGSEVADFLGRTTPANGIITNPPFKIAPVFIAHALTLSPYVAMLVRLGFLEGTKRKAWFEGTPLARVHISSRRLPMMHRDGWEGPRVGSQMAFAWFIWDLFEAGPEPVIRWFDWHDYR